MTFCPMIMLRPHDIHLRCLFETLRKNRPGEFDRPPMVGSHAELRAKDDEIRVLKLQLEAMGRIVFVVSGAKHDQTISSGGCFVVLK